MRSPAKKKGAPYFVQSRSEAKLYKQLSTTKTIAVYKMQSYKMQSPIHDGPCDPLFMAICHLKGPSDLSQGYISKKNCYDGIWYFFPKAAAKGSFKKSAVIKDRL